MILSIILDTYTWKVFKIFFVAFNYVSQGFSPQSAYVGWKYRFGSHKPIGLVTEAMGVDMIILVTRVY